MHSALDELKALARQPFYWLLVAFPLALFLKLSGSSDLAVFLVSAIAVLPLAGLMGLATDALAERMGPTLGGLLNATFGNAAELILGIMALRKGPEMYPLVKASITGSIVGNFLLVTGASVLAGGLKYDKQKFNTLSVSTGSTLLAAAAVGLLVPTVFFHLAQASGTVTANEMQSIRYLSEEIAVVLALLYILSLLFSLVTHRDAIQGERPHSDEGGETWSRGFAIGVLLAATIGVAIASECLTDTVESAAHSLGMNQIFIGAILIAIIGNAAEHSTAVMMALKNDMETSLQISIGSGTQVALLVAPLLLLASVLMGQPPLDFHFTPLEIVAVIASVGLVVLVSQDGESNWMEGAMLLGVYLIFALAFFHFPYAS